MVWYSVEGKDAEAGKTGCAWNLAPCDSAKSQMVQNNFSDFYIKALSKPPKAIMTVLTVPSVRYPSEFYPRIQPYPFRRPSSSLFLLDRQPVILNQNLDPGLDLFRRGEL